MRTPIQATVARNEVSCTTNPPPCSPAPTRSNRRSAAVGRHFSPGHDLKEFVGPGADLDRQARRATAEGKFRDERQMYFDQCLRIYAFPKPTIVAVQAKCIAAGMMLTAIGDLIVAAHDASFSNPVARMTGAGWSFWWNSGSWVSARRRNF